MKPKKRNKTGTPSIPKPCRVWDNVLLVFVGYDETTKRMVDGNFDYKKTTFPSRAKANSAVWHEVHALIEEGNPPVPGRFTALDVVK